MACDIDLMVYELCNDYNEPLLKVEKKTGINKYINPNIYCYGKTKRHI